MSQQQTEPNNQIHQPESAEEAAVADQPSVDHASGTDVPSVLFSSPLHLIPPSAIAAMLSLQQRSLASLRASSASLVAFEEYAAKSFEQINSIRAQRIGKIQKLRESLTDLFLRIRQVRIQLHGRTAGLDPYVDDEEAEHEEIEQLKRTLIEEEAAEAAAAAAAANAAEQDASKVTSPIGVVDSSFLDGDTSLPYLPSPLPPNSLTQQLSPEPQIGLDSTPPTPVNT